MIDPCWTGRIMIWGPVIVLGGTWLVLIVKGIVAWMKYGFDSLSQREEIALAVGLVMAVFGTIIGFSYLLGCYLRMGIQLMRGCS